jgi:hypothetical protein
MQVINIQWLILKKKVIRIVQKLCKSCAINITLKFYLKEGNLSLLGGFGQFHSHVCIC